MAHAPKIFKSVKLAVLSSPTSSCHRKQLFCRKFELVKTWTKTHKTAIDNNLARFRCKLRSIRNHCIRNVYSSGSKFSVGSAVGVSIILGSVAFSTRLSFAMDGIDIIVEDSNFLDGFNEEEHSRELWTFVRKLWLPTAFVLTVLLNLEHPVLLFTQVVIFLLTTRPSPLSVYIFVEQLCHQSMRQEPYLYSLKSLYANKVEVEDYRLFCLATVEVRNQKLSVLGILGGWWALPSSQGASMFWHQAIN